MSWVIWIGGRPDGERSAVARAATVELRRLDGRIALLELDEIRKFITPSPRETERERYMVCRALVYVADLLSERGISVIVDAAMHGDGWRDLARAAIPHFAEIEVDPGAATVAEGTAHVVRLARQLTDGAASTTGPRAKAPTVPGWAIWITGRPGSGKTTLARRVAEALAARGVQARMLDHAGARRFLVGNGPTAEADQDIIYRALAYAAKRLVDAGLPVIVDATASRRVWREAARMLIPCFAEVQLLCPVDACIERERAVHWGLTAGGGGPSRMTAAAPDIVLGYEESFRPDLMLRTDLHEVWDSVEQVLALVQRLARGRPRRRESPEGRLP
jgi:adenylylsulfate kinase